MEAHFEKPCDLSPDLIKSISLLIAEGGEVNNKTLRNRLLSAALIGYIVIDEKVVATAAIKKPHDTYLDNVSIKAESDRKYEDFRFELGYVMVTSAFRRKGFASLLCKRLCHLFQSYNLYASTRADNHQMQRILYKNGFTESGRTFRNKTDTEDLKLFIRRKPMSA